MGKINWGTTAQVLLPLAATVIQKHFGDKEDKEENSAQPSSFKRGGMVRKTGKAKVHKDERVLTKSQTKKYNARKR